MLKVFCLHFFVKHIFSVRYGRSTPENVTRIVFQLFETRFNGINSPTVKKTRRKPRCIRVQIIGHCNCFRTRLCQRDLHLELNYLCKVRASLKRNLCLKDQFLTFKLMQARKICLLSRLVYKTEKHDLFIFIALDVIKLLFSSCTEELGLRLILLYTVQNSNNVTPVQ